MISKPSYRRKKKEREGEQEGGRERGREGGRERGREGGRKEGRKERIHRLACELQDVRFLWIIKPRGRRENSQKVAVPGVAGTHPLHRNTHKDLIFQPGLGRENALIVGEQNLLGHTSHTVFTLI
jgi:hypothetical protein